MYNFSCISYYVISKIYYKRLNLFKSPTNKIDYLLSFYNDFYNSIKNDTFIVFKY